MIRGTLPPKLMPPQLQRALLFNLLNNYDPEGWKSIDGIRKENRNSPAAKEQLDLRYKSPRNTIHNQLRRLEQRGLTETQQITYTDNRRRVLHKLLFRIRRDEKTLLRIADISNTLEQWQLGEGIEPYSYSGLFRKSAYFQEMQRKHGRLYVERAYRTAKKDLNRFKKDLLKEYQRHLRGLKEIKPILDYFKASTLKLEKTQGIDITFENLKPFDDGGLSNK